MAASQPEMSREARHQLAADHLLRHCGTLVAGERVAVIHDPATRPVGAVLIHRAQALGAVVTGLEIPPLTGTGQEPPPAAAHLMSNSDLILGLTWRSLAHTRARVAAVRAGARYLSLPEYSLELLEDPALLVDYRGLTPLVRRLALAFTHGSVARITSAAGTALTVRCAGRVGNACPGWVGAPGELGSPPDIEANVSPLEDGSDGVIVVDGSIPCPEVGLLSQPLVFEVTAGVLTAISGADSQTVERVRALFSRVVDPKAYILAELGVGLNPLATLRGVMLTDEGAAGCVHFGFGSNATVGGYNAVAFHQDVVITRPTLTVDETVWIEAGRING